MMGDFYARLCLIHALVNPKGDRTALTAAATACQVSHAKHMALTRAVEHPDEFLLSKRGDNPREALIPRQAATAWVRRICKTHTTATVICDPIGLLFELVQLNVEYPQSFLAELIIKHRAEVGTKRGAHYTNQEGFYFTEVRAEGVHTLTIA